MSEEKREGIINAVKSPLGLTVLIVLVAESMTVFAMLNTPKTDPIYRWYYVIMIGILLTLIPAYYIYLGILKTKAFAQTQSVTVADKNISVSSNEKPNTALREEELFKDSNFEFELVLPKNAERSGYLNYKDFLTLNGLISTDEEFEPVITHLSLVQFGEAFIQSKNISFHFGEATHIQFTDDSATTAMESQLAKIIEFHKQEGNTPTKEEIAEMRRSMNFNTSEIDALNFVPSLSISILPKKYTEGYGIKPGIANIFLVVQLQNRQLMDELQANNESILWKSNNTINKVSIKNKIIDFTIYRIERILEDKENFFLLTAQWSPDLRSSYEVWDELRKTFESFRLTRKK